MDCVNCGRENPSKALICYWCGLDPVTGQQPYGALVTPVVGVGGASNLPEIRLPAPIEVPPPMPVPSLQVGMDVSGVGLTIPDLPPIEIAPPPPIADQSQFTAVHRRAQHRPVFRASPARPTVTRPVLPGWGRAIVFIVGLAVLLVLGMLAVAAVGAASLGTVFCLMALMGLAAVLWVIFLLARIGKRAITWADTAYERLEVLGQTLREVVPGLVHELPVNLPREMGVSELPVAYSELRSLAGRQGEQPLERAVDLVMGAVANLVARDDVILARRTFPVTTQGLLTQPTSSEVSQPVLTRRRVYVGSGELEQKIAQVLRTDQPMSVGELVQALVGPEGRQRAQRVLTWVDQALSQSPPNLDALASPDDALAELERFREAIRQSDPELYELLEAEVRRGLGAAVQRTVPSSWLDLARPTSSPDSRSTRAQGRPASRRRG